MKRFLFLFVMVLLTWSVSAQNETNFTLESNSSLSCAYYGETCGGITGIACCGDLVCDLEDNLVADASGVCVQAHQTICTDLCGDGECQSVVCQGEGCPCAETQDSCPNDCLIESGDSKGFSFNWLILLGVAIIFVLVGLKILKWLFWSLAIIALVAALLLVFYF